MEFIDWLAQLDESLLLWLNGIHSPYFDTFMYLFSGKLVWIPMYAAILYVLLVNFKLRTALLCLLSIGLVIVIADQVGASLIRPMVERLRPSNLDNPISELVHIVNGVRGGRYGFPSCHAANTVGLAVIVHLIFRHRGLSAFMAIWAIVTCYSRIYLGVHYPGDIIVGSILGALSAWFVYTLLMRLTRNTRYAIPTPNPGSPKTASIATAHTLRHIYAPAAVGLATILAFAFVPLF